MMNTTDHRGDEYLTNSEIEEMEATAADFPKPSQADWDFYTEISYVDPFDTISGL